MHKKILILQSNYIPWKGYFDMINMADEFVIYDEVQYTKNDWRNRNRIKTLNGVQWITIPVRHTLSQTIRETKITDTMWARKHWNMISQSYARAACFRQFKDQFEQLYLGLETVYLTEINITFIKTVNSILDIPTKITMSGDYAVSGERSERLVEICKKAGANEYISGPAAKNYLDEGLFERAGIRVTWMDYSGYREYKQLFPPFEHSVSVLDLIFNEGQDAKMFLKSYK